MPSVAASRVRSPTYRLTISHALHLKQDTELAWHALCFRERRRVFQMYSILYIIGAIVVIIVVLRVLGLL
jgi:hypothetical protein